MHSDLWLQPSRSDVSDIEPEREYSKKKKYTPEPRKEKVKPGQSQIANVFYNEITFVCCLIIQQGLFSSFFSQEQRKKIEGEENDNWEVWGGGWGEMRKTD